MCGLILAPAHYSELRMEAALTSMGYRGKGNRRNVTTAFGWRLAHTRLAIQDLSHEADQPFVFPHSVAAFVGELFNHNGWGERNLLQHLLSNPADFHEVDGFWSVVEVRASDGVARCFTDHIGIKPLYWWPKHNIVCSEIFPMFQLEPPPPLDEEYLRMIEQRGYCSSGQTPFQGIFQLPPGSVLNLRLDGGPRRDIYWNWSKVQGDPGYLRDLVMEAIDHRMEGDREVAVLLSGGLDSSIVYYGLKAQGYTPKAFSVENGETEFLPEGVKVLPLDPVDLSKAVLRMQAPLDLGSLIPQIQLAEAVSYQGFHVVLSGDGADELFGGYRRAKTADTQWSDTFEELPYYHLPRLDRIMMRNTIELRTPFLAPKVMSAALRLPYAQRTEKQALKEAFKDLVPEEILRREKHPLKTQAVIQGGIEYRRQLIEEFRHVSAYL